MKRASLCIALVLLLLITSGSSSAGWRRAPAGDCRARRSYGHRAARDRRARWRRGRVGGRSNSAAACIGARRGRNPGNSCGSSRQLRRYRRHCPPTRLRLRSPPTPSDTPAPLPTATATATTTPTVEPTHTPPSADRDRIRHTLADNHRSRLRRRQHGRRYRQPCSCAATAAMLSACSLWWWENC